MSSKLYPCITKSGELFASYDKDSIDISDHVNRPYWSNDLSCVANLIFDVYGKKPCFSTSNGTGPGFGCADVSVQK